MHRADNRTYGWRKMIIRAGLGELFWDDLP